MNFLVLMQVLLDIVLLAGVVFVWVKLSRPAKDDPRLSRGLQLLQNKISILEDLSDKTETQVQQITNLMDQKLAASHKQIEQIETSMGKSMEIAKIFQDKIPHKEIIERQNTIKYVKAARMAHSGASIEEISKEVDLPAGELEFIAKVNRNQLQFSEDSLPEWARESGQAALSQLGDQFRKALGGEDKMVKAAASASPSPSVPKVKSTIVVKEELRKFEFPKVDMSSHLR